MAMSKLQAAVLGKNRMNIKDLPNLTEFVHTGR